jgi:hypothetical protein
MALMISDELGWTSCCACGVAIGMPASLLKARQQDQQSFWCPNGHSQKFTESTADRLQRQLTQMERERDSARISRDQERGRAEKLERALKRAQKAAGK